MKTKVKRHHRVVITPEAKALREIRLDRGLSIREVCRKLGKSEAFLRHIETGRRDFPRKILLETILQVYEVSYKAFRHKVSAVREAESKLGPKEELKELIDRLPEDKIELISKMIKGIV